jgi:hypothetical protein
MQHAVCRKDVIITLDINHHNFPEPDQVSVIKFWSSGVKAGKFPS